MKRWLAIFLLSGVLCVLLWACVSHYEVTQPGAEIQTLVVWVRGSARDSDVRRISEALSAQTKRCLDVSVEIKVVTTADYAQELQDAVSLHRAPDVVVAFGQQELTNFYEFDLLCPLDELLPRHPDLQRIVPEEFWSYVTRGEQIIAVPSCESSAQAMGFLARQDIMEQLGIEAKDITTLDELHDLLCAVKAAYPDMIPVMPHLGRLIPNVGVDRLSDGFGVLPLDGGTQVENQYTSEAFVTLCQRMHQWYQEGLILPRAYTYSEPRTTLLQALNGFGFFANVHAYSAMDTSIACRIPMETIQLSDPYEMTDCVNVFWCITAQSTLQEEALGLIELLATDREAADLCLFGQEGVDYARVDENTVTSINGVTTWNSTMWGWPNRRIASTFVDPETRTGEPYRMRGTVQVSPAIGFVFADSGLGEEQQACQEVVDRYVPALLCGYLDPEQALPMLNEELEQAGQGIIIAEKQRQLDNFLNH